MSHDIEFHQHRALLLPGAQDYSICCKLSLKCLLISTASRVVRQTLSNHHTVLPTRYAKNAEGSWVFVNLYNAFVNTLNHTMAVYLLWAYQYRQLADTLWLKWKGKVRGMYKHGFWVLAIDFPARPIWQNMAGELSDNGIWNTTNLP